MKKSGKYGIFVTEELLRGKRACEDGLEDFRKEYPRGAFMWQILAEAEKRFKKRTLTENQRCRVCYLVTHILDADQITCDVEAPIVIRYH